jgi:phosphoglycolate phosphatase
MPIRARKTLLLDLDGTLVDPAAGIIGCCRDTLEALGVSAPAAEDLRWVIGPSIRQTFARLLDGRADPEVAVRLYRERYADGGLYQAEPYAGVREALLEHQERGTRLILCTAKAHVFAHRVVDHFGFAPLIPTIYGPELDGRFEDKADLMAHLLTVEGLDPGEVCMVGDRRHDVIAASRNGVPTIGVRWGYAEPNELEDAGAALVIESPAGLLPPA